MNDTATHPTEGWVIQKNKRGIKHVTGLKPLRWRGLRDDKGFEYYPEDIYASEGAARAVLVKYLETELPKARKRVETMESTLAKLAEKTT